MARAPAALQRVDDRLQVREHRGGPAAHDQVVEAEHDDRHVARLRRPGGQVAARAGRGRPRARHQAPRDRARRGEGGDELAEQRRVLRRRADARGRRVAEHEQPQGLRRWGGRGAGGASAGDVSTGGLARRSAHPGAGRLGQAGKDAVQAPALDVEQWEEGGGGEAVAHRRSGEREACGVRRRLRATLSHKA